MFRRVVVVGALAVAYAAPWFAVPLSLKKSSSSSSSSADSSSSSSSSTDSSSSLALGSSADYNTSGDSLFMFSITEVVDDTFYVANASDPVTMALDTLADMVGVSVFDIDKNNDISLDVQHNNASDVYTLRVFHEEGGEETLSQ